MTTWWTSWRWSSSPPSLPVLREAEAFETKPVGGLCANAAWSGGKGWNIWTNGSIEQTVFSPTARSYVVEIRAAGALAGPDLPRMVLRQNGVVVATWDVASSSLLRYPLTRAVGAGEATFRIEFTNDYRVDGQDQNLGVDLMRLV